jgi:hypothetical protein
MSRKWFDGKDYAWFNNGSGRSVDTETQRLVTAKDATNKAMHTKPPIARFANGERVSDGSVITSVRRPE